MAAVAPLLLVGAGFGINSAQLHTTQSKLSYALDAAVTSTARDLTTGKIKPEDAKAFVTTFLHANGDADFALGEPQLVNFVIDKQAKTVSASASVDVDLFFPVFGTNSRRTVKTQSAAVYSDKRIEIAMMLDITGSMSGQKIKDLKAAATNAVDAFLGSQDPSKSRVRVALIPYADAVNTGILKNTVHVEKAFTSGEPPKLDDPLPASGSSASFDGCATERKGSQQFTDAGPYTAMVNRDYRLAFCPKAALMPLTSDADALKARIASFVADSNGYTAGHIGTQWSWYMLSDKWASVLPAASAPIAADPKKVAKYAILMTDGEYNTAFAGVAKGGTTKGGQATRSRDYAERLCDEMKKDGIEIFTVGFMLKEKAAKDVMKDCASKDSGSMVHYFEVSTGAELDAAYQQIAHNIERLALTK